ncbi:MAG: hypothetical protein Q7T54_01560 [Candidatus Levybacteria bacterium]|nr:hypothetical protein [Candidatus Levybacteria bacterium]
MNPAINQELTLLRDFLDRENELGILIGSHQNTDTYAAALSLYLSLTQAGKKVQIISKKQPTVEVSNLVGVDRVKENFIGSTKKLVVALPYIKGEVEKVLFTEAPNTINFHLTAAQDRSITPFELSDVKLMWEGGAPQVVITVGVGTIDELSAVADPSTLKVINIDNYQGNTRFGDVVLVEESFSSLSEVVGKIIKDISLPMDVDIAQNILDGVLYATRNFTRSNTSPLAFEAASAAMYQGAKRKEESHREQGLGGSNARQAQERLGRDQGQNRGNRDQGRSQSSRPSQRVSDNDFPAMHMQPHPSQSQTQNQNPYGDTQVKQDRGQINDNRRMPNPNRSVSSNAPRPNQQFGQNRNVDDIRNKIMEEVKNPQAQFQSPIDDVQEAQIIEDQPQMSQPIEDVQTPEDQPFVPENNEDIPDDWLMPKVFKSSKNNN